jgi:oligosaccharide repeat unit polymerase
MAAALTIQRAARAAPLVSARTLGEIWMACLPLLTIFVMQALGCRADTVIRSFIVVFFACSLGLVATRLWQGFELCNLGRITFAAAVIFWYSGPAMLLLLSGYLVPIDRLATFDSSLLVDVGVCVSLFWSIAVLSSVAIGAMPAPAWLRMFHRASRIDGTQIAFAGIVCCMIGLLPYLIFGNSPAEVLRNILGSRSAAKAWAGTSVLGNGNTEIATLASIAMIAGTALLWMVTFDRATRPRVRLAAAIVALLCTTAMVFDSGTRSVSMLMLVPPALVLIVERWKHDRLKTLLVSALGASLLALLLTFQLLFRAQGKLQTGPMGASSLASSESTFDFFSETIHCFQFVPRFHDYFRENLPLQFIAGPIPRTLWPNKPESEMIWSYTYYWWGIDINAYGGNLLPGIVGQFYMNRGLIGVVWLGVLLGWIQVRADSILMQLQQRYNRFTVLPAVMFVTWMFLQYRSLSPGFLYPVLLDGLLIAVMGRALSSASVRRSLQPDRVGA